MRRLPQDNGTSALTTHQLQVERRESHRANKVYALTTHQLQVERRESHRANQVYALTTHQLQVERRESHRANQVYALTTHQLQVERRESHRANQVDGFIESMKSFERLVLAYLKNTPEPLLDPLQFAYRANRSVDDKVNMGLHFILQNLDRPGTYVRILFVDFISAFNSIIPVTLQNKLTQLSVPTSICQWINSFLTDRQQLVRLGKFSSSTRTISTWSSSGLCSLPTALLSLHQWLHI